MPAVYLLFFSLLFSSSSWALSCKKLVQSISKINSVQLEQLKQFAKSEYQTDITFSEGKAQKNAIENYHHIERLASKVQQHRSELSEMGVDVNALVIGIYFSDMGKSERASQLITSQNTHKPEWQQNTSLKSFLRHEDYGIHLLTLNQQRWGLSPEQLQKIIDAITNHNGPGIPESWFGARYLEEFGQTYQNPVSFEGVVHTFLDRVDQGSLFVVKKSGSINLIGGVRKIVFDEVSRSPHKAFAEVVQDIFFNTPNYSIKQVETLVQLSETQPQWAPFFNSSFFHDHFSVLKNISTYQKMIQFPHDSQVVMVGSFQARTPQELFDLLERSLN